ncbi:class I SAM-dependent methyltransferase [Paraburkholderia sp. UCT31]|uniref:class I SAM-dependent methyltransferase n=1 Tax=Paraburkholderia sp. UCT31 TaxID=2615209 RepID=UPI001655A9D1|nr:class I SAM-dependent methyltransferase [Paraburkholderia sp. UCT31]MBC8737347.1 class I SAM-dependent methyltransferase [Paraburkholderia sp. UCT31]
MTHHEEIESGQRFGFGENWSRFLSTLDEEAIGEAKRSLQLKLGRADLEGLLFLDIGSGSGLFSLAARRLGARVHSVDFDPQSVACTRTLRERFFPADPAWVIEEGSAIDEDFMDRLPDADIVYSWGVLHHTGQMWRGLDLAARKVGRGGQLYIALYNDEGAQSCRWKGIKQLYNVNLLSRVLVIATVGVCGIWLKKAVAETLRGRNPLRYWTHYKSNRGMSAWHDLLDWLGGYPFEVASPEAIFYWGKVQGLTLEEVSLLRKGYGCNEFVFCRR